MYGVIAKKSKTGCFTFMDEVFEALGSVGREYNWLLSDIECAHYPSEKIKYDDIKFENSFVFLDGNTLYDIVYKDHFQFIWGVFTAFKKDITAKQIAEYPLPYADGNPDFWEPEIKLQNPHGEIEIVAWDSTLFLVIAKDETLIEKFKEAYPSAVDLAEYNRG